MTTFKKHKLLWIRVLMFVSQVMLLAIITSWLFAQYDNQKTQLVKDLNIAMQDAGEAVMDSIIHVQVLDPLLEKAEFTQVDTETIIKHNGSLSSVNGTVIIDSSNSDSIDMSALTKDFSWNKMPKDSVFMRIQHNGTKRQTIVYRTRADTDAKKIIAPILRTIVRTLSTTEQISSEFKLSLDTLSFRELFKKELDEHHWKFNLTWHQPGKKLQADNKAIVLKHNFNSKVYAVSVNNYAFHLLKKITPQILFVVFLLIVTSAAFLFTYHTLKEQIKLGIIKNEFISNMSHELKTPISTVKVALEAINNFHPITDNQTTRDYLEMAAHETERLEMLVNQSLNISLIEQGRMVLQKEPYDIKTLLDKTLQAMQVRFRQNNAEVHVNMTAENTQVNIDILHMQGVLVNLLDNSLKYGNETPVINIGISEDATHVFVSIADNGLGIPEEYISKVFDKFFRVPTGNLHNVKGYGLGLSYVKQVIAQHGGSITAGNLQQGCIFTIALPKI